MDVLRYTAFSSDPAGGNPAGVVLDATGVDAATMQRVAAEVGYSETAFLVPAAPGVLDVRYFSPLVEVPFCGHATIASAVALAERDGPGALTFRTPAGRIAVTSERDPDGALVASLVSVVPRVEELPGSALDALLDALGWDAADLDPALPPRVGDAGARHPVLAVTTRARLADLDYDDDALAALSAEHDWATVDLLWREDAATFHSRNPFPTGGVVEDPATGAAAAALGGYLRALGLVDLPASLTVHQGHDLGRPSLLRVEVPVDPSTGVTVTGTAVPIGPGAG